MDDQNIPIDINANKLLDWLISRRHVSKDWQNNIVKVREKINNAIQDMPEHQGIVALLSGQHINYFHCRKIIEILKETEADTKNLFGRYGSQRMKDWQDILQSYQRDNLYLGEAAQILIRNINFEILSLRKQIAKFEQVQADCEKKIKDHNKNELVTMNEFNAVCKQLGISGTKIKRELTELLGELPQIYEAAVKKIVLVDDAINLYVAFVRYHSGEQSDLNVLPLLRYVVKHGNTTTYEYTYGEKPIAIEPSEINITEDEPQVTEGGIDFGDEIDLGGIDNVTVQTGEIDWGNFTTEEDFEIIQHEDLEINLEESGIVVENSGNDGGVARGSDAYTLLDNPKTRDQFLNDLMELESFLVMRLFEMSNESESDLLSMSQMQHAPLILQMQTAEGITSMIDAVRIALNELQTKRTQHLHNIKHSPKYVDMLTASLNLKLAVVERLKASKSALQGKIKDARENVRNIQQVLNALVSSTKTLQKQLEDEVSAKYKGRPVHIVGATSTL